MTTFILIHGAWHGAWCWYKVIPRLRSHGHQVFAPDLPSLGRDATPLGQVSLASWTDVICQLVDSQAGRVTLVGHSRGGLLLSTVAERLPNKVEQLIYVTAGLLRDGESLGQLLASDGTSLILPNLVAAADGQSSSVRVEALRETFYNESSAEDIALSTLLLKPEPRGPAGTPMQITDANFGSVPRFYIECLRDRAIPLQLQRRMVASLPCKSVLTIDTDHSPFFSTPERLADLLLSLTQSGGNVA